jgi:hypothetical protein
MKTVNKNSWMAWAIIVLAIMNLTTLITVLYNKSKTDDTEVSAPGEQAGSETTSVKYSGRFFRDGLNLSNEQMKSFAEFNPQFRQNVFAINQRLDILRRDMLDEMAKQDCDTNRLNNISDSIGYQHARLKKQTYLYYLNFKRICNEEQLKKLEQLFGEMFISDVQLRQNGRGGQGGRRYGWRNKN